ncbi:zinc-binding protein A33-like [Hypanus sabinus]|uniref:zinc-binding protein A33-like n=1 Tax=Hypanus sabinus TaxID=79690 RepID=UPI0028C4AE3C|nr:zinc-binding protein A33-like [Hypanus sabinus]
MSGRMLAEGLTSEVTCPVCQDLFRDPVRLECEHNFCRSCIGGLWGELESGFRCPECRETFPQLRLKSNRLLANIVERVRQLRLDTGGTGAPGCSLCPWHDERLKLYCQDDQEALCVVCGVSKEHKDHHIVPLHEAQQLCQEKLKESSNELAKHVEVLSGIESSQEEKIVELKEKTAALRERMVSELDLLRQFLQQEQDRLLDLLREEESRLLGEMQDMLRRVRHQRTALESEMANIQQRLSEKEPATLLQDIKDLTERVKQGTSEWQVVSVTKMNIGPFQGPLQYAVWKRMRGIISPATNSWRGGHGAGDLTSSFEHFSQQLTAAANGERGCTQRPCPCVRATSAALELTWNIREGMAGSRGQQHRVSAQNVDCLLIDAAWPAEFLHHLVLIALDFQHLRIFLMPAPLTLDPGSANPYLVLSEDLTAARYSYASQQLPENLERFNFCACVLASEGFASGRHYWEVEVGDQPDWDVGVAAESIDREGWVILTPENGFWTFGHVQHPRIGVYLDHEEGQVSFYRADDMTHLHTYVDSFSERLFPFFYPSADSNAKPLKICHLHI